MPVKYIGMASVIHQIVINKATPAVNHPILPSPSGGSENINIDNMDKPIIKPNKEIVFLLNNFYSHSIVAGGFDEISKQTREISGTLLIILVETSSRKSNGKSNGFAVIKSIVFTAVKDTTFP